MQLLSFWPGDLYAVKNTTGIVNMSKPATCQGEDGDYDQKHLVLISKQSTNSIKCLPSSQQSELIHSVRELYFLSVKRQSKL